MALPGTRHRSNVALSSSSQCIQEIRQPPVTLPTRTARAHSAQAPQASQAYPFLGQTRKCYSRKLTARTGLSNSLTTVNKVILPVTLSGLHDFSIVSTKVIPIWNTMGVIPGHIKDEVVFVGNHRDGACWTSADSPQLTVLYFV